MLKRSHGVTLIELIIGIVVLAISLSIVTSVLGPLYVKSADPWHQVRAAELGHSLMNEILGKAFDEHSNRSGSLLRCDEAGAQACTAQADFGADCLHGGNSCPGGPFEQRSQFDDVDDFDGLNVSGDQISNIFGNDPRMAAVYRSYSLQISVSYDNPLTKRVLIEVTTPTGAVIDFAALKGNW
ncbi:MAG: type II secretion system GspH family protein [Gammaproteobacteria bacterium]|nr:type II secretion system GspH family protein [Gammaproteobacteria bacterium]MBU1553298.1 type II secretion system GspH family protein [Gammaproteobacteria bacterium]MBU2070842.1 type II secretion system GspH family protein [Gammaproteobacteria bacterium]MBU2182833.1 type II secretion system GspH family protein [Gammaproteobacteria bacterium]MBU2203612.1 type II secretion system GspH family protein [Gammaproteobacteria bacterium]